MLKVLLKHTKRIYYRLRFGKVHYNVKSVDGSVPFEYEILDKNGNLVGYWAYGHYDPSLPYRF